MKTIYGFDLPKNIADISYAEKVDPFLFKFKKKFDLSAYPYTDIANEREIKMKEIKHIIIYALSIKKRNGYAFSIEIGFENINRIIICGTEDFIIIHFDLPKQLYFYDGHLELPPGLEEDEYVIFPLKRILETIDPKIYVYLTSNIYLNSNTSQYHVPTFHPIEKLNENMSKNRPYTVFYLPGLDKEDKLVDYRYRHEYLDGYVFNNIEDWKEQIDIRRPFIKE